MLLLSAVSICIAAYRFPFARASAFSYHIRSLRERGAFTLPFPFCVVTLLFPLLLLPAVRRSYRRRARAAPFFKKFKNLTPLF
ncbi:hypothetical protein [Methanimicrococcus stummii]|uniref:hypothetical protein n=1 Tax=Methanimicrococcus stummii TaxID=3028294 RepID=UPI00292DBB83|nr:hypothetical protein [Methanimicrococcus sp. Es2]